jgi:hypothetical protein
MGFKDQLISKVNIDMKYLAIACLIFFTINLQAQDLGALVEQRKYSAWNFDYHDDYSGSKQDTGLKTGVAIVSIYENKVVIEVKSKYSESKGIYGKGERITGPNWYGYELGSDMKLVISRVNTRIYSEPEVYNDEEVYMVEQTFMNPIK